MTQHAAITARALKKRYTLGQRERYGAMRDVIGRRIETALRPSQWGRQKAPESGEVWALDGVSFDIEPGAVVGIIGRNGSGKSTLLKILSRITEPTSGEAEIRGRVGSLLEVGTGFHPELTGRENVFVNGAILGMKRREIVRRFDEIVAFAEVDRFIDTPVKHYSSGMQMRLAFAVAAHLQPEILLVDEVLAVGDAEFQRRCLGKMHEVSREGRTVILVSHQMGQIRRLCGRVMWLDRGRVRSIADAGTAIGEYESAILGGDGDVAAGQCFGRWEIIGHRHTLKRADAPFTIRADVRLDEPLVRGHFGVSIHDDEDRILAGWAFEPLSLAAGRHAFDVRLPSLPLRPGTYRLSFALFNNGNNLTGGRLVEKWSAVPLLTLDVPPVAHPQDEWAGILNIPSTLTTSSAGTAATDDASAPRSVVGQL